MRLQERLRPATAGCRLFTMDAVPLDGYMAHFRVDSAVCVSPVDKGGGWGLRACRKIAAGDVIASVPRRAVVEVHAASSCPWLQSNQLRPGTDHRDAERVWSALPLHVRLALALLDLSAAVDAPCADLDQAAMRQYVEILPREHAGALAWSRDELLELHDAWMLQKVEQEQARVRGHLDTLSQVLSTPPTEAALLWALQSVLSRAFAFRACETVPGGLAFASEEDADTACLLPVIDSANHDPEIAETNLALEGGGQAGPDEGCFVLKATGHYEVGQEVDISYGCSKSNDKLLLNYGFVIARNLHDDFTVPELSALGDGEADGAGAAGGLDGPVCFSRDMSFLSGLESAEHLEALAMVCDTVLADMETSVQDDEALLAGAAGGMLAPRRRMAVEFRVSKKRLLSEVGGELRRQAACSRDREALFQGLLGGGGVNLPGG